MHTTRTNELSDITTLTFQAQLLL